MIKTFSKISLAVGMVGAVALLLAVFGTDGSVKKGQAAIVDFKFGFEDSTQKFVDALDQMGHPPPQVYELNGNKIFFSKHNIDRSPKEALTDYQQAFVDQGLNNQVFDSLSSKIAERTRTGLTGGVIPMQVKKDHVIMNGVIPSSGAETTQELFKRYKPNQSISKIFEGYRWVEVFKSPGRNESTVLASWSNDEFDFSKMEFPKTDPSEMNVHRDIPVCPGCGLINQFSDENVDGLHETYIFSTTQSIGPVRSFYSRRLEARGWEQAINTRILDRLRNRTQLPGGGMNRLEFSKDGKKLSIEIFPREKRKTGIRISLVDQVYLEDKKLNKAKSVGETHIF